MRRLIAAIAVVGLATSLPALGAAPAAAATFPTGFTDTLVAPVEIPTAIAQLPDGTILVTNKIGGVIAVNPATGDPRYVLSLVGAICTDNEQGVLGLAVDPGFSANGFVYVYYTSNKNGGCAGGVAVNRVSRFTYDGAVLVDEWPIIDEIPTTDVNHNAGYLYIANDGKLYVSVGDGGNPSGRPQGQNPAGLNGKILRVNLDGTAPADNLFLGDSRFDARTFAWGLRNPYRLAFKADAPGVRFRIHDVGERRWEEINEGVPGANYGWAVREGPCAFGSTTDCGPSGYTDPTAWYAHGPSGCSGSLTGGAFVPDGAWSGYDGAYLFGDWCLRQLYVQRQHQAGATFDVLSGDIGQITDLRFIEENGRWVLYYTSMSNGGELHRVVGPPPAPPPVPSEPAKFVPVPPARVLDTRIGLGVAGSPVPGQSSITLPIAGRGIVPGGATAVALNVTGDNSAGDGYVTVWPSGVPRPTASTLNFSQPDDVAANAAVVPLGTDGAVQLFTQYAADLIADITGYWVPAATSADGRFSAVDPVRILDTRTGTGAAVGKVPTGGTIDVQVTGVGGIPATGVAAVAVTVTVADADFAGFVSVWPTGSARPVVSSLNPTEPGDIRANLVIVPVGADGQLSLYTISGVHLIMDVAGWFSDGAAVPSSTGLLRTIPPTRLLDTRLPSTPFNRLAATEQGTTALRAVVTGDAQAVFHNLTMTATAGAGYISAAPGGAPPPLASNVNATDADQNRAALALTRVGPGRTLGYTAGANATDLVVDVSAWLTPNERP